MAQFLFSLSGVTGEEAEEIRQLLTDNEIPFYETGAGFWGTGVAAIWLENDADMTLSRQLLDSYQQQRGDRIRREWQQAKLDQTYRGWLARFKEQPVKMVLFISLAVLVAYLSVSPFIKMMD